MKVEAVISELKLKLLRDVTHDVYGDCQSATGLFIIVGQCGYVLSKHSRTLSRPFDKQLLRRIVLFAT
jgi:hypothetical protein